MSKRGADKYLTDQNYNDDDDDNVEDEEQSGTFQQASAATLATREIKKAKRRTTEQASSPASGGGAFQGFTGLAGVGSQSAMPLFKFGADANKPFSTIASVTSPVSSNTTTVAPSSTQSTNFVAPSANAFGGHATARFVPTTTAASVAPAASSLPATTSSSSNGQKSTSVPTYQSELKSLNESVLAWIDQHVRSNPHCILSPIFADYDRYVEELDRKYPNIDESASSNGSVAGISSVCTTSSGPTATLTTTAASTASASTTTASTSSAGSGGFQFGATHSTSLFGNAAGTFGSSGGTFGTFGSGIATKSEASTSLFGSSAPVSASSEATTAEGDDDEYIPPKPEVVEIKEDDAFYTIKCKLFYQKDKSWQDRGVGNLYLKPCGGKTQLLVRADTNLGNILLNIMLTASVPTSRQGPNNVSFACIPNPPIPGLNTSTPIPMLIRVKTGADADALYEQLISHKQ